MTVASKRHLSALHELPCVVCLNVHGRKCNAQEAHHVEAARGSWSDFATVPLCGACHDLLHAMHRRAYYRAFKLDDVKLMAWTIELLWKHDKIAA